MLGVKNHPFYSWDCCEGRATHLLPRGQLAIESFTDLCAGGILWWHTIDRPQLCLCWSFHPPCVEIVPGSHLLCSTFCVLVLYISILRFQIPSTSFAGTQNTPHAPGWHSLYFLFPAFQLELCVLTNQIPALVKVYGLDLVI